MFNILFQYPRVLARHRRGPSAQARERYLTHRADQGAARDTLLRTARELLVIAQRLDLRFAVREDPANTSSKLP